MSPGSGRYSVVFLDLDGTVLDFDQASGIAIRETLQSHRLPHGADAVLSFG